MAILTEADIKTEFRLRVGDTDSTNYFMSQNTLASNITKSARRLNMFVRNIGENVSLTADGGASYTVPTGIHPDSVVAVGYRYGTDHMTDVVIKQVQWVAGKLRFPTNIPSGCIIFIQFHQVYTIGTDDIPDYVAEIMYDILTMWWYDYALARRSDFEQWASTNESDSRISEIIQARRVLNESMTELASSLGNQLRVSDLGGGA